MAVLTAEHRNTLIDLLTPLNATVGERQALVFAALGKFDIELEGSPLEFTIRLIQRTLDHGHIEPGKPALWAVLDSIRPRVGVEKHPVIDALRGPIHADPATKPDKPAAPTPKKRNEQADDRTSRQILLGKVRDFWVEGVFRPALKNDVWLELPVTERPQALEPTPDRTMRYADYAPINLTRQGEMGDMFRGTGRALLILGAPGAGKTMTLLELASDLINQASKAPDLPTPIVLNLSSWAEKRPEQLAEWIAERLNREYGVLKKAAERWIANGDLTYLFDGLDEVPAEHREACVTAINAFWQGRDWVDNGIVVCSRVAEYEDLKQRLQMRNAILLEALPLQTALDYLGQLGPEWAVLRAAVEGNAMLQDMATSPLLLSIMVVAYRGAARGEIPALADEQAQRRDLFDRYVARRLREGEALEQYPHEKTRHYLAWLARGMKQHGQTVFHIEDLSGSWVEQKQKTAAMVNSKRQAASYLKWSWRHAVIGIFKAFWKGLFRGIVFGIYFGGMLFVLIYFISTDSSHIFSEEHLSLGLSFLIFGFIIGIFMGLLSGILNSLVYGILDGVIPKNIEITTMPNQLVFRSILVGLAGFIFIGLVRGILLGILGVVGLTILGKSEQAKIIFGAILGALLGLTLTEKISFTETGCANPFLQILIVLTSSIVFMVIYLTINEFLAGFFIGTTSAVAFSLKSGLGFAFDHNTIRQILYRSGDIPRNYAEFLIYASERHLMRRVGGGFVFRHRLLLEHFTESAW